MDPIGRTTWYFSLVAVILLVAAAVMVIAGFIAYLVKNKGKTKPDRTLKRELIWLLPLLTIPLLYFAVKIGEDLVRYSPDEWRFGRGVFIEDEDVLRKVLKTADTGGRDRFAALFSERTRNLPGFDEELNAFFDAYPGDMADIELDRFSGTGLTGKGYTLDNGIYVSERYRAYAGLCGDSWYLIYIRYIDYCKDDKRYIGINEIVIQNAGARLAMKKTGETESYKYMFCDIKSASPADFRIIQNEVYEWNPYVNHPLSSDQMKNALAFVDDYDDMIKVLGTPNACVEDHIYFYEALPEDGEYRYFAIGVSGHNGFVNTCRLYGPGSKMLEAILDRGHRVPSPTPTPPLEEAFTLTLNSDYSITRTKRDGFRNIGWHIERNGEVILDRNAENETYLNTKYQWLKGNRGSFTIYLTAYVDGSYQRVSNIIEYTL